MASPTPDEIQRQISEVNQLRASTRRWQIGSTLLIVVILCAGIGSILSAIRDLAQPGPVQEKFMAELQGGLKKQVVPELDRIAKSTMNDVRRDVEKELKRVNERSPELMAAFNKELETLQHSLPQRGEKVLEGTIGKELKTREAKIKAMFPNVKEEQVTTMVNNLVSESHSSMENLSKTVFGKHLQALTGISANLDTIKRTEKLNPADDIASWETALGVLDLLREDMKPVEDSTKPAVIKTTSAKTEAK
ncbi:MAG TPA: hypothetical protein VGH19_09740 [Verrucomicrobiae bacterium]